MPDRKIAIFLSDERRIPDVRSNVGILMSCAVCPEITVFSEREIPEFNMGHERTRCSNEKFPGSGDSETARRNAILKKYEAEGFGGILHVISDDVNIVCDPSGFIDDLESMMREFDYPLWLSTVTDPCNYVYSKYNPRLTLANDMQEMRDAGIRYGLSVTSHSNTAWMAYDMAALAGQREIEYFDERFNVSMFYIVELLARRREHRRPGQLFYMNQYLTVTSERGVFKPAPDLPQIRQTTQQEMQDEDEKFKAMGVKYEPDYGMDAVLDAIAEKIIKKTRTDRP